MTERNLTDADVDAIVTALEARVVANFYRNLGAGVWEYVKKAVLTAVFVVAAYGAVHEWKA